MTTESPATRSGSAPRRSGRERKKVESVYDEAARDEELLRSASPKKTTPRQRGGSGIKRGSSDKRKSEEEDDDDNDDKNNDDDVEVASEDERSSSSEESDDDGDDDSDDDDNDFGAKKDKTTPDRATTAGGKNGSAAKGAKKTKKTQIRTGRSPVTPQSAKKVGLKGGGAKGSGGGRGGGAAAKPAARRAAHQALASLAKNVLPPGETPGLSSLVAGLLHSYRPAREDVELGDVPAASEYTPNLVALARKVIAVHNDRPNRAQLALLNLLFRSVGGSEETDLSLGSDDGGGGGGSSRKGSAGRRELSDSEESDAMEDAGDDDEVILDEMDTDEWARVVTDLVDDMRHVPATQILVCADPLGAVHQAHEMAERERRTREDGEAAGADLIVDKEESKKHVSAGAVEYRRIYREFWYVLGHVALTDGGMATTQNNEFESQSQSQAASDDASASAAKEGMGDSTPIVRLDAELVKSIILRIVELSPVGQPDVRAAATLAALSVSHAVLDQSAILVKKMDVASRQYAAAAKSKSPGKEGAKAEALKVRMESLKRTVEDLEEVVLGPVVQGLLVHRYRDSNEHIRTMCIESLSRFSLQRPDLFLTDKYLKYFGWMMHDKNPRVRCAAFDGLLQPFKAVDDTAKGKAWPVGNENLMIEKIDLSMLDHVVAKFLPRIADAVMDPVGEVQEVAMNLMLVLLKGGFLDDVSDDKLWDQTNQRCLAEDAPAAVQNNALYFILDQLEAFDDGGENEKAAPDERKRAQQLDAIASYAAHTLTNGPVPIDKIRVEVCDLLVKSLRSMPEHRGLVTDWSAMLRAIKEDNAAATAHHVTAGDRANVAKQRVLVRMLACAAREEVGSVAETAFLHRGADADAVESTSADAGSRPAGRGKKAPSMGREHENLSIALLKALPNLLIQFKGDLAIIPELASLPRFLIPTVFSLPQRKQDFMALIKNLGDIYLSSSDDRILDSTARSLVSLCDGDHARIPESKAQLRKVVVELRNRVVELMSSDDSTIATSAVSVDPASGSDFTSVRSKRRSSAKKKTPASGARDTSSPSSDKTSLTDEGTDAPDAPDADSEYSIFLNLKRLKILSKKCDLSVFFDDRNNVNQLELLCNFVTDGLKSRLRASKPVDMRLNADEETAEHKVIDSPEVLGAIGKSVGEGLEFLLCVIAWFTHSVQVSENLVVEDDDLIDNAMEEDKDDNTVEDHTVLRLRSRLLSTLELCFAQYILSSDDHGDDETSVAQHSEHQHSFSDFVQLAAGKVTSDLRTLFPKEYADAASPILRSFALQEDGRLIGAYVRFLDSKEHLLRENDDTASSAERKLSQSLLYPMGRAVATNWTNGNRREAGMFLRHIGASGPTAADIVSATSRQMKKIDPVRMLESQMASLRQSYEIWIDDTPELESDFPSEEEMADFEYAEKTHKEQFAKLEHRASQFSQTLGVFGRLSDKKLGPALNGFVREGIRFSFSNLDSSGEDSLVLGSRLSFLLLLSKYASWAKKNKKHKAEIQAYVDALETEMRDHEEFEDVHVDDLESLATFRQIVGLKPLDLPKSGASVVSGRSVASARSSTVASARSGRSVASAKSSTVASARSGRSVASARSGRSVASAVSGRSYASTKSGRSVASAASGRSVASAVSGRSVASARSGRSVASGVSGRSSASVVSGRSGASVMSERSGISVASARSGVSVASARSGASVTSTPSGASAVSARTGVSVMSARTGTSVMSARSGASVDSGLSASDVDGDESLDGVSVLPSPAPSTGTRSAGSRASRSSRLSSTLPTLPESSAEKEESPQDEDSDSDSHFSESPGNSSGEKRFQSQMTYEHSGDDDNSVASSVSDVGSEMSRPTKSRRT